jgi:hypothetical protein
VQPLRFAKVPLDITADDWELYTVSDPLGCATAAAEINAAIVQALNEGGNESLAAKQPWRSCTTTKTWERSTANRSGSGSRSWPGSSEAGGMTKTPMQLVETLSMDSPAWTRPSTS